MTCCRAMKSIPGEVQSSLVNLATCVPSMGDQISQGTELTRTSLDC
jgi:hypothetical protein